MLARIGRAPEDADAHLSLGLMWRKLGLSMEALESFETVLELDTASNQQSGTAYLHVGELLADAMSLPDEAEIALLQSVELDPQPGTWSALGKLLFARGALHEAQEALSNAVKLAPNEAVYRASFAKVLRSVGLFSEARFQYKAAAELGCEELDQALSYYYEAEDEGLTQHGANEEETGDPALLAQPPAFEPALEVPPDGLFVPPGCARKQQLSTVYRTRVASAAECEWVVAEAERSAGLRRGGWSDAGHHDRFKTHDVIVADNNALREWLDSKLRDAVWPALAAQFGLSVDDLWLMDAFIVKYEPSGQSSLASHIDDSELSFNIALSDPSSFQGGGTSFAAAGQTVRPQQGEMVSHFGRVFHAGEPVTEGTRHILAGFVCAKPLAAEWRELRPRAGQKIDLSKDAEQTDVNEVEVHGVVVPTSATRAARAAAE